MAILGTTRPRTAQYRSVILLTKTNSAVHLTRHTWSSSAAPQQVSADPGNQPSRHPRPPVVQLANQAFTIQTHAEWSYWFVCLIPAIIIAYKSDIENTKALCLTGQSVLTTNFRYCFHPHQVQTARLAATRPFLVATGHLLWQQVISCGNRPPYVGAGHRGVEAASTSLVTHHTSLGRPQQNHQAISTSKRVYNPTGQSVF